MARGSIWKLDGMRVACPKTPMRTEINGRIGGSASKVPSSRQKLQDVANGEVTCDSIRFANTHREHARHWAQAWADRRPFGMKRRRSALGTGRM